MEELKKFEEICEKDVRHGSFGVIDQSQPGGMRHLALADFYRAAERIQLHEGVPEEIRSHFQTARNLIIYTWFYYPFNMAAELCAFTSVEYAFRLKSNDPKTPFKFLLKSAVEQGWVTDKGFSVPQRRLEAYRANKADGGFIAQFLPPEPILTREYCDVLVEVIPSLRNNLAHGSSTLHEQGASTVRTCAELINQLWLEPKATVTPRSGEAAIQAPVS